MMAHQKKQKQISRVQKMSTIQKYKEFKEVAQKEIGEFANVFLAFTLPNDENSTIDELTSAALKLLNFIKNN
jgi:CheY-specific phosphatase CheX